MLQPHSSMNSRTRFFGVLFLAFILILTSTPVIPIAMAGHPTPPEASSFQPQDPQPTVSPTPDEVLEQAKREALIADELKKKAVADKERAEAEAAKLKAETQPLGAASVTIPTGSVQTDAAGWVESQMLAQEAARQITDRLSVKLCTGKFLSGGVAVPVPPPPVVIAAPVVVAPPAPTQNVNALVIYNNNDLAGVELYVTVMGQLDQLKKEFEDQNPKANTNLARTDPRVAAAALAAIPVFAAPGIATGVIKSVGELINLFRTDTTFQNKSVQISEDMVVSHIVDYFGDLAPGAIAPAAVAVAGSRCHQSIKIYYPALFPTQLVRTTDNSALVILLNQVEGFKNEAAVLLERTDARIKDINNLQALLNDRKKKRKAQTDKEAELTKCKPAAECIRLRAEIKELKKAIEEINGQLGPDGPAIAIIELNAANNFKDWLASLTDQKSKMQARITATELLSAKLNTPDAGTKLTALAQLLRAEKLSGILSEPQTFTLRVAVTANGTTKIKKNMFVDAKVRHSAGANVVYQLFNRDGALAQADVMQCYIGYSSSQYVQGVMSGSETVVCKSN